MTPKLPRGHSNFYNRITDFESNKRNPFIDETISHLEIGNKTIMISNKESDLIVSREGELRGHTILAVKKRVDKAQFMKLYFDSFKYLYDLSKSALRVFGYIAESIKDTPNKDTFLIDFDDCEKVTKYSRKTINSAIAELIGNKFIARGPNPYIYFVNPTIFFNGDRLTLVQHYEVEPESKDSSNDELILLQPSE